MEKGNEDNASEDNASEDNANEDNANQGHAEVRSPGRKGSRRVRHQPASRADLRRFPPEGPACIVVRAMLRDYADRDLKPRDRVRVEEHAHECRDCGVALSRVEAEVYGLRQALHPAASPVPADFVTRVMERLHDEPLLDLPAASDASATDGIDGEIDSEVDGQVGTEVLASAMSEDFTPRVMERIRREWKPTVQSRVSMFARRHAVLLIAAAAAAAVLLWLRLSSSSEHATFQVLSADATSVHRGVRDTSVIDGDVLLPGDRLLVQRRGRTTFAVREANGVDRAEVEADGNSRLELATLAPGAPAFRLVEGSLDVRVLSSEELILALGEVCHIELERGTFSVFAERVERHDQRLANARSFIGVTLMALSGRARIVRGSGAPVTLDPGFVATFDDWSAIRIERFPTDAELVATMARRDVAKGDPVVVPAPAAVDWLGRVISAQNNAPVASASVTVRRPGQPPRTVVTVNDGSFRLEGLGDVEGQLAMIDVTLPEGSPGAEFGNLANFCDSVTLRNVSRGQSERRLDPIRLAAERRVMGRVLDAQGRRLAGARVTPVIVDALAGGARRLPPLVADVVTDVDGRFTVRRLPAAMPPYLDTYLLVEHAQYGAVAALDLLGEPSIHDQDIEVAMVRRDHVSITDLPAGQPVEILASIRNLAPSAMLQVSPVTVSAAGTVEVDVAEGASLWLRHGDVLVALVAQKNLPRSFLRGDGAVAPQVAALATQRRARRVGVVERGTWRYDVLTAAVGEPRRVALMDRDGHDLSNARLFLASKMDGSMVYLGEMTAAQAVLSMPAGSDYRVVAVSEDGAVGVADANELQEDLLRIRLLSPGSAHLPDEVVSALSPAIDQRGGFLIVELQMVEPLRDYVVHRHAGRDSGWELRGLIPGTYRFTTPDGRSWQTRVPPGGRSDFSSR